MPNNLMKELLSRIDLAVWIYDFDNTKVHWANQKALIYWNATSLEELTARDLSIGMSPNVALRLNQFKQDFQCSDEVFNELWTLHPANTPKNLNMRFSQIMIEDGRIAMLVEASEHVPHEPEALRSIDALMHTSVMISIFQGDTGKLIYSNPAARMSFGSKLSFQNEPLHTITLSKRFVDSADLEVFLADLDRSGTCSITARVYSEGCIRWHHMNGAKCLDPITGDISYLISEQDVNDMEVAKLELETSRNEALEANKLKSDFVVHMSHELRTPLNGVIGVAEVLKNKVQEPTHKRLANIILDSSEALLNTLNDILDLAKIEANKVAFEEVEFNLTTISDQINNIHTYSARSKGLYFSVLIEGDENLTWVGDPHWVAQILHNLVNNAIKFTPKGYVSITLSSIEGQPLTFEVKDTGIGMTADQVGRLFWSFEQAEKSTTRKFGGTGLGMSIVRRTVDAMNGAINVTSNPDAGTVIKVSLPMEVSCKPKYQVRADKGPEFSIDGLKVLVIDDVETNHMLMQFMINDAGGEIISAYSGREGLDCIGDQPVDMVLCDIQMPDMDGVETLREIRKKEKALGLRETPVVAVTASALPHQIEDYLNVGFAGHIAKPIRPTTLYSELNEFLANEKTGIVSVKDMVR